MTCFGVFLFVCFLLFFRKVYAYFLRRLMCTCIHESDAELTCMCLS